MKGYSSIQITTAGYTDTGKIIQMYAMNKNTKR